MKDTECRVIRQLMKKEPARFLLVVNYSKTVSGETIALRYGSKHEAVCLHNKKVPGVGKAIILISRLCQLAHQATNHKNLKKKEIL